MASGDIAVNLIGNNQLTPAVMGSIGALGGLDSAIDRHIAKLNGQARAQQSFNAMINESIQEQSRGIQISGRAQGAINQLIFAVDDAATVYGQQGLAGAVRAAGNNLTMAASMMGPWAAAIGVGVMAATQLGMALSKTGDEAQKSTKFLDEFKDKVGEIEAGVGRLGKGKLLDPMSMTATEAGVKDRELEEEGKRLDAQRKTIDQGIKDLEAERDRFAVKQSKTPDTDVLGGLNQTDRQQFDSMNRDIERQRERRREIDEERNRVGMERFRIGQAIPDLQQRELDEFGAQQNQADIRQDRAGRAAAAAAREMAGSLRRELMKGDINPEISARGRKEEIAAELMRREREIEGLGNVDPVIRNQMMADAQAAAVQQMTRVDRDRGAGLSARGPATLRAGEADTMRFLAQARLGAAAKSGEERELSSLNDVNREMLAAIREQTRKMEDKEPVVVLDF